MHNNAASKLCALRQRPLRVAWHQNRGTTPAVAFGSIQQAALCSQQTQQPLNPANHGHSSRAAAHGPEECSTSAASSSSSSVTGQLQQAETQGGKGPVQVFYQGHTFSVPEGTKLRTALLQNGVSPHNGNAKLINCRGLGTCGTCAVEIRGAVQPDSWTTAEQLRLNFPPHKPPNNQRLRLACQVACLGPQLEVIKRNKFWGEGDEVVAAAAAAESGGSVTPLGSLEFLLDPGHSDAKQQ